MFLKKCSLIIGATVLCLFCSAARAQDNAANTSNASNLDAGDSIAAYEKATSAHPTDGAAWEHLGAAYLRSGQYDKAIASFQRAIDNGFAEACGKYNLACAYARVGDKAHALSLLSDAVKAGLAAPLDTDPDLASLRNDPAFQGLVKSAEALKHPCKDPRAHPEYRQLDFWLGDWDVFSGPQKVGDSEIKLILGDCVVFENWKDTNGGEGKSFNKYNNVTHQWEQFWVEDDGGTQYFTGKLEDGEMRYLFDQVNPAGIRTLRHLTFSKLSGDKVRQFSQKSVDDGKTWATEYDLTYIRKKAVATLQ